MVETGHEWKYKLLDKDRHARLVENLVDVCSMSGIPEYMLDKSMADCGCTEEEMDWVRSFHQRDEAENKGGLMLAGDFDPSPNIRLLAMGAAFIRNFIDARVVPLFALLPDAEQDGVDPTILIIPDFCRTGEKGGHSLTHWQSRHLQGMIQGRFSRRKITILHVENMQQISKEHGKSFADFLIENWDAIEPHKAV